uniref:hypothetical protein n=1 Tax=Acinetobacter lwoffii TaxID=28090 RepID=UPI0015EF8E22|nr:hypothetical protein [Acinetobacter lwoffii]
MTLIPFSKLKSHKTTYRRLTFSLTEDVDRDIDELLINCRVARANRSIILKAAIEELKRLSKDELQEAVIKHLNI